MQVPKTLVMRYITTLILGAACIVLHGQAARRGALPHATSENTAVGASLIAPVQPSPQGTEKAVTVISLGAAANLYTALLGGQNQVMYNPDINTLIFQHRQDPADYGGAGTSASLRVDRSTDGGTTWTLGTPLLTPNLYAGNPGSFYPRYPSATIYNPAGNTDPANAYVVSHGPALEELTGTDIWGLLVQASAKLDGSNANDLYVDHYGDTTSFHPYGLTMNPNGEAWSLSTRYVTTSDPVNYSEFDVNKGVFNSGTNVFDWNIQQTIAPDYFIGSDGLPLYITHNMAFSPDGQTGYAVVIGKENDGLPQGPAPLVWKSIDAGATWTQLPNHDFSGEGAFADILEPANGTGLPRPWFSDVDCTVDANGHLHLFGELFSGYTSGPDSQNFIFSAVETQFLFHASTGDGLNWFTRIVDNVYNTDYDLPSSDPANIPAQSNRPQAGRSPDGTRVFFTWNSSNPEPENYLPDVWAEGYNVSTGLWTGPTNLTQSTGAEGSCWFHTLSPVCISGGSEHDHELPIVFAEHNGDALGRTDFFYLRGAGFDDADFVIGVQETEGALGFELFPNPAEDAVQLRGGELAGCIVTLHDATGRVVLTVRASATATNLDLRSVAPGLYSVSVEGPTGKGVKNLVVR